MMKRMGKLAIPVLGAAAAVLLLPAAAYRMGADGAALLTPIRFFSDGNPLFASAAGWISCLAWFVFSLLLLLRVRRRWNG